MGYPATLHHQHPTTRSKEEMLPSVQRWGGILPGTLCLLRDGLRAGEMFQEPLLLISDVTIYTPFLA